MTFVAAGWPTTFWDRIAVRFSAASGVCFLALAPEGAGLGRSTIQLVPLYRHVRRASPRRARFATFSSTQFQPSGSKNERLASAQPATSTAPVIVEEG